MDDKVVAVAVDDETGESVAFAPDEARIVFGMEGEAPAIDEGSLEAAFKKIGIEVLAAA